MASEFVSPRQQCPEDIWKHYSQAHLLGRACPRLHPLFDWRWVEAAAYLSHWIYEDYQQVWAHPGRPPCRHAAAAAPVTLPCAAVGYAARAVRRIAAVPPYAAWLLMSGGRTAAALAAPPPPRPAAPEVHWPGGRAVAPSGCSTHRPAAGAAEWREITPEPAPPPVPAARKPSVTVAAPAAGAEEDLPFAGLGLVEPPRWQPAAPEVPAPSGVLPPLMLAQHQVCSAGRAASSSSCSAGPAESPPQRSAMPEVPVSQEVHHPEGPAAALSRCRADHPDAGAFEWHELELERSDYPVTYRVKLPKAPAPASASAPAAAKTLYTGAALAAGAEEELTSLVQPSPPQPAEVPVPKELAPAPAPPGADRCSEPETAAPAAGARQSDQGATTKPVTGESLETHQDGWQHDSPGVPPKVCFWNHDTLKRMLSAVVLVLWGLMAAIKKIATHGTLQEVSVLAVAICLAVAVQVQLT